MSSKFLPLESNPDMLTSFIRALGVNSPARFVDIWSFDAENSGFFPQPIIAVCLLYPSDNVDSARVKDFKPEQYLKKESAKCTYIKQVPNDVGNACGTIAITHALCNNLDLLSFSESSPIPAFAKKCRPLSPEDAAKSFLEETKLRSVTSVVADQGQTATPDEDDEVNHHFIAFVISEDEHLLELDGMKPGPVDHGPCTLDMLFLKAISIIRDDMMVRDPGNVNFSAMGLTLAEEEE